MPKKCKQCGVDNTVQTKFCRECGGKSFNPVRAEQSPKKCKQCGEDNTAQDYSCQGCGGRNFYPIQTGQTSPTAPPTKAAVKHQPISKVGLQTDAGLACPRCGGTDFKVKRSKKAKLALGVFSLAVKGSQVRCVPCGTIYKRG